MRFFSFEYNREEEIGICKMFIMKGMTHEN